MYISQLLVIQVCCDDGHLHCIFGNACLRFGRFAKEIKKTFACVRVVMFL